MTLKKELKSYKKRNWSIIIDFKGYVNKDISNELKITERTVKNHVSSIFRKINVNDRTQAAVFAVKNSELFQMMVSCDVSRETFLIKEPAKRMFHVKHSDTKWTNNVPRETFNKTMEITIQKCYNVWA